MSEYKKPLHDFQGHPENLELIDFKCSQYWSNHYFQNGYSRYRPPSHRRKASVAEEKLRRDLGQVIVEMNGLYGRYEALMRKVEVLSKEVEGLKAQTPTKRNSGLSGVPVEDLE